MPYFNKTIAKRNFKNSKINGTVYLQKEVENGQYNGKYVVYLDFKDNDKIFSLVKTKKYRFGKDLQKAKSDYKKLVNKLNKK